MGKYKMSIIVTSRNTRVVIRVLLIRRRRREDNVRESLQNVYMAMSRSRAKVAV